MRLATEAFRASLLSTLVASLPEKTPPTCAPPAVCVDDDLAACEAGVPVRPAKDVSVGRVQVEYGPLRDHGLDHVLFQVGSDLVIGSGLVVLCRDEDSVDPDGNHGALVNVILDRDLGLLIKPHPGQVPFLQTSVRRALSFVARTWLKGISSGVSSVALVHIEPDIVGNKSDPPASVTDNLLVIHIGPGGDLVKDHDHIGLGAGLASDLALRILREAGIEDCVGDLVAELVGVTLVDVLGSEQEGLHQFSAAE
ncbi:hypothetical protein MLD38_017927 [Melastoma candidum]|uniref:Uncharacterized protein n=1 Tax=Melastoma candidum TaxID=119954 RepID=A0ACB9QRN6_9MYRT|nr:hypothetical protein MLD38_017927 [Melastoma candidum]